MDKYIEELFSLPVGLKVEAVIDGQKFYSSEKLKQSFIRAFEKSGRGKPVAKDIAKMVEDGSITPCYLHKGLIGFLKHRTFGGASKTVMGFYHMKIKKVYVLIDNNINIFGTGSSDLLVATTMHECMHLLAGTKRSKFFSIFGDKVLTPYYQHALKNIFLLEQLPDKSTAKNLYQYIGKFENARDTKINSMLSKYHAFLTKELAGYKSSLDKNDVDKMITQYIVCIKILLTNFEVFIRVSRKFTHILGSLQTAYTEAFNERNTYTTAVQELVYPSEVACVYSEMKPTSSPIKQAFRALS